MNQVLRNYCPTISDLSEISFEIKYPKIKNPKKERDHSWDFTTANTKEYTHCYHSYPAMMIPQVARKLIDLYSKPGYILLDPFCGSGSALLEAKMKGLKSYGIDINPLALLIAKAKTTIIEPSEIKKIHDRIVKRYKKITRQKTPDFYNINFWFKEDIIKNLARLRKAIFEIENEAIRNFFKVAFSETVRDVSNTRNAEFKLYRIPKYQLENYSPNVLKTFESKYNRNLEGLEALVKKLQGYRNTQAVVLKEDSRKRTSLKSNSIDLLITSPPYGDSRTTVAYGQFSRLSLQWIGYNRDDLKTDVESLGGKTPSAGEEPQSNLLKPIIYLIGKKDEKRALDVFSYFFDLQKCFFEFKRVMKPKSTLCFVLGNRTVKGVQIPTDEITKEMGENMGWEYERTIIRSIPSKRMPSKNSPSNIKGKKGSTMVNEYIVIFNNQ